MFNLKTDWNLIVVLKERVYSTNSASINLALKTINVFITNDFIYKPVSHFGIRFQIKEFLPKIVAYNFWI